MISALRRVAVLLCAPAVAFSAFAAGPLNVKAFTPAHMVYNGGSVETMSNNVAVYWGSGVASQTYFSSVPGFLGAIGNTPYLQGLWEYNTPTQAITSMAQYTGSYTITPSNTATNLLDTDVRAELNAQITGGHLPPPSPIENYVVMFPPGVNICLQAGECSNNLFCAYHQSATTSTTTYQYIVLPYEGVGSAAYPGCAGSATDDQVGSTWASLELVSTITDPVGNTGWLDNNVGEVPDPCTDASGYRLTSLVAGFTVAQWWSNMLNTCIASNPNLSTGPKAIFPALANGAYGGYTTTAYVQDIGTTATAVAIVYFDSTGEMVGTGDLASVQPKTTWTVAQSNGHSFAAGQAGSAVVYAADPLATFVNESAPGGGDATSYTGIVPSTGSGTILFAPAIANNAYGGYTTGIGLINAGTTATDITVKYLNAAGTVVKTQTLPGVAAGTYEGLYSGDPTLALPSGFAGTATIISSGGTLAAIVNETGPGAQNSSYDAVPSGSTTLYAPAALRNAYGGYNTGMGIQNTGRLSGTVTITYYNSVGTSTTTSASIPAFGYAGVYQGTDITSDGAYTAKITSTVPIAAIVNEVAPSVTSAQQSTAYNTFASGSTTQHLPLVESAGSDGWSTGEGIMNTGSAATTVTVTYYDTTSGAAIGSPQNMSLQPNAFWGLYQPTGGLSGGARASALVTTSGGQVAVICNESNATSFMSYSAS